jgi:hypothetical protein
MPPQQESSSNDTGSTIPSRIDVVIERVANLQSSLTISVDSLNKRFDSFERKSDELGDFQNKVLGGIAATTFTVRALGWVLGVLQIITLTWAGAINYGLHTAESRLTTLEVTDQLSAKDETERKTSDDSRFDALSRRLSGHDAELQKLEIDSATKTTKH